MKQNPKKIREGGIFKNQNRFLSLERFCETKNPLGRWIFKKTIDDLDLAWRWMNGGDVMTDNYFALPCWLLSVLATLVFWVFFSRFVGISCSFQKNYCHHVFRMLF